MFAFMYMFLYSARKLQLYNKMEEYKKGFSSLPSKVNEKINNLKINKFVKDALASGKTDD